MQKIQMVDLKKQYEAIKTEVDAAMQQVIDTTAFINGPEVKTFANELADYMGVKHCIPCANGTDALQIALMALELQEGDEVLVPTFNYVATAEVIALLKLKPVFIDVDPDSFTLSLQDAAKKVTERTKAIMPVHLFGQAAPMAAVVRFAQQYNLFIVEDNAQAIGSDYYLPDGNSAKAGTIGHIGTTSFFPSKNLGCYGDGGAIFTNDDALAAALRCIASHGQAQKYIFSKVGVNSRLDSLQAALLRIKLQHLDQYNNARLAAANYYDKALSEVEGVETPLRLNYSSHVFHQYTLKVKEGKRDALKNDLAEHGIPSMIYYPKPLHLQEAYAYLGHQEGDFPIAEQLCNDVLSLPIHTELTEEQLIFITQKVKAFFA